MAYSHWILLLYTLWFPTSLLAQSGLEPTEAGTRNEIVRRGMGVFGKVLAIHGDDTLALRGDLVLVDAEVMGEGILSLCASHPQQIIARKSSVQNLHIANPTTVTVRGELTIRKSLVIEQGLFDSRLATLVLTDTCRLRIGREGQVRWPENSLLVKPTRAIPQPRPAASPLWANTVEERINWPGIGRFTTFRFAYWQAGWPQTQQTPPSPPPEGRVKPHLLAGHNERSGKENLITIVTDNNYEV